MSYSGVLLQIFKTLLVSLSLQGMNSVPLKDSAAFGAGGWLCSIYGFKILFFSWVFPQIFINLVNWNRQDMEGWMVCKDNGINNTGWISIQFCKDIHGLQRMNHIHFCNSLIFYLGRAHQCFHYFIYWNILCLFKHHTCKTSTCW